MGKEDFNRQIEIAKQKIADEKLQAERKAAEEKCQSEVKKRNEEIERQNEKARIIKETRKNFAGTNIIETLEEIRDKHLLVAERNSFKKSFFTGERIYFNDKNEPMIINYNVDSVTASFDAYSVSLGHNEGDGPYGSETCYRHITITKTLDQKNNLFELKFSGNDSIVSSTKPADIVTSIANFVALEQTRKKIKQDDLW